MFPFVADERKQEITVKKKKKEKKTLVCVREGNLVVTTALHKKYFWRHNFYWGKDVLLSPFF